MITFIIDPVAKPRMTQSDKWNVRKPVADYIYFKDLLNIQAKKLKYQIGSSLRIIFYLKTKNKNLLGKPHKQTPDIDNLVKAFLDALSSQDCGVYRLEAVKYWGETGKIEVFEAIGQNMT